MTRPPYYEMVQCKKCEWTANHTVEYQSNGYKFSGEPVDEHLVRTCRNCSYEWEEAVRG